MRLGHFRSMVQGAWMAILVSLADGAALWAQQPAAGQSEGGGGGASLAVPYFVVLFGAILGLLVMLHPSKRRDRPREEQFAEKKRAKAR